jgi:uncharacterized membrane protein
LGNRIAAVDLARAAALLAMAVYHFAWDLEFFGYLDPGTTISGGWKIFARSIATSFLFLVGVSLVLAHGNGIRWHGYWKRLAMVAGAAAAITAATWVAFPQGFIFFGILHQIALASLIGLAFVRVPWPANAALAACVVVLPMVFRHPVFDHPALWWVGLAETPPRSNDYVPLFPWFGAVLAGMAFARFASATGLRERLVRFVPGRWASLPLFLGRHSLAVYLVHQPVIIGLVWLAAQVAPPAVVAPELRFTQACEEACVASRDAEFCAGYCACMLGSLEAAGDLPRVLGGEVDEVMSARIRGFADMCSAAQPQEGAGGTEEAP